MHGTDGGHEGTADPAVTHAADLRIGLIGFGEVGGILGRALVERGVSWVGAWDRLFDDRAARGAMLGKALDAGVHAAPAAAALLEQSTLVISAVTASQTQCVAEEAAPAIRQGTYFIDMNSASPGTKAACARRIDAAGGRYVEAAVMNSVPPYGIRVPMLLGGPHAASVQPLLDALGFAANVASTDIGVASAIKMCRSVFIKGLEAIVVESLTTARQYGVEDAVLASLSETYPEIDWEKQAAYLFSRVAAHGRRRAEEMREAAATVQEAGLQPLMAAATASRQDWVASLASKAKLTGLRAEDGWRAYADRLREPGEADPPV